MTTFRASRRGKEQSLEFEHGWKPGTLFIYSGIHLEDDIFEETRLLMISYDPLAKRPFVFLTACGNIRYFNNPNEWRVGWISCRPEDDEFKPVLCSR